MAENFPGSKSRLISVDEQARQKRDEKAPEKMLRSGFAGYRTFLPHLPLESALLHYHYSLFSLTIGPVQLKPCGATTLSQMY